MDLWRNDPCSLGVIKVAVVPVTWRGCWRPMDLWRNDPCSHGAIKVAMAPVTCRGGWRPMDLWHNYPCSLGAMKVAVVPVTWRGCWRPMSHGQRGTKEMDEVVIERNVKWHLVKSSLTVCGRPLFLFLCSFIRAWLRTFWTVLEWRTMKYERYGISIP